MGRLFWKFLWLFWLAQLATALCVGGAIWALHGRNGDPWHGPGPPVPGPAAPRGLEPLLLPMLAGSVVSLVFAFGLARHFSRPIRRLRTAFEQVAEGRLGTRIGAAAGPGLDELAELGRGFDRMAARLQGMIETQDRLLHDVSHELRSPLARLQVTADLMRQQPQRQQELLQRIERDTGRMDALIGELLTLARLDASDAAQDEDIELGALVRSVIDDAAIEAQAKGCPLLLEADATAAAAATRGRARLLQRAVENVVRNAIAYSPAGQPVTLSANCEQGQWTLTIRDQGPGVAEADLLRIFEPFFRSGARRGHEGWGLGLAIAARVLQAQGGHIAAANRVQGGLEVSLSLPLRN